MAKPYITREAHITFRKAEHIVEKSTCFRKCFFSVTHIKSTETEVKQAICTLKKQRRVAKIIYMCYFLEGGIKSMKEFQFREAKPLLSFLEENKKHIIGHTLRHLFSDYWPPENGWYFMSDEPVIIEMDDYCVLVHYIITSDISLLIGNMAELRQEDGVEHIVQRRSNILNYFEDGVRKEDIEGRTVINITIDRFSNAFEYNIQGDQRPEGGDYFSAIKLHFDSGKTLCLCGDDAEVDGYIRIWCE